MRPARRGDTRIRTGSRSRGATLDIKTLSLYVQDRWTAGNRVTADLGVRYEKVRSEATGGIVGADTDTVVPRLGVSFDVEGNGQTVAQATYARYSGRFTERAFARNDATSATRARWSMPTSARTARASTSRRAFNLANYVADQRQLPDGEHLLRRRTDLAEDERVHAGARPRASQRRLCQR